MAGGQDWSQGCCLVEILARADASGLNKMMAVKGEQKGMESSSMNNQTRYTI